MSVRVRHEGPVSVVSMNLPPQNLLNIETLDALVAAHQEADEHGESRVIITRSEIPAVFSNGLDPMYVLKKSPEERIAIFEAVGRTLDSLFRLGKPHLAEINGPAMAGGAIIAITADFRIFDAAHGRISFSEPKVGLPIPETVSSVISLFCDRRFLREIVLLGKNMDAKDALRTGLADAMVDGDAMSETVGKYVERLSRLSPRVLRETKIGYRRRLYEITAQLRARESAFSQFVGDGYLGEGLRALVEKRFPNFEG